MSKELEDVVKEIRRIVKESETIQPAFLVSAEVVALAIENSLVNPKEKTPDHD